jgi:hypothetical protein
MKKFEDPKQNDPMSRMQNDLDETKIVLVGRQDAPSVVVHLIRPLAAQHNRGGAGTGGEAGRPGG